jgi:hypothetical protein
MLKVCGGVPPVAAMDTPGYGWPVWPFANDVV